jgi:hypothetical protein
MLWHRVEAVNAVTYFAPECRQAAAGLGLRGFWMGYFACRAAPLGLVGPGVVEATFFNFHPVRVRRAIPDAWAYTTHAQVLDARARAAARALRRLLGSEADQLAREAVPLLATIVEGAAGAGRPLFAANREVHAPPDPVAWLWQLCTAVREHRGDGHVALLAGAGLDGCEAHVLFATSVGIAPALLQDSRGWSAGEWSAATDRLSSRALLDRFGVPTTAGNELHEEIERRTDELALVPLAAIGGQRIKELLGILELAAARISASGDIPFPNPIGLPPPTT